MCLNWFKKKPPVVVPDFTDNTIIHIAIGDFPGKLNDLAGPPNDQIDFQKRVLLDWPHYTFRTYKDSRGTVEIFKSEVKHIIARMKSGDTLAFIMDTCFSGTNTRGFKIPKMVWATEAINYIAMSAARPFETADDAVFDGRANGAYHYCLIKTLEKGITWKEWDARAQAMLARLGFDHVCTIEGSDRLTDRKVFEGTTYVIVVSSHGDRRPDGNSEEEDGYDEYVVFFNGVVCDDEIAEMLKNIPSE